MNSPSTIPGPIQFDENGHVVMTEEDYVRFANKINAVHLPIEERKPILLKFVTRKITEKEYHQELFKARFIRLLEELRDECDEWIEFEDALARFEGEGGRVA